MHGISCVVCLCLGCLCRCTVRVHYNACLIGGVHVYVDVHVQNACWTCQVDVVVVHGVALLCMVHVRGMCV